MPNQKYHHLIPQTYMRPWCHSGETIWVYDKGTKNWKEHNIGNILGINYYHSIVAGSFAATSDDAKVIFAAMNGMTVEWAGKIYNSPDAFNAHYNAFDEWMIKDQTGNVLSKKQKNILKNELQSIKLNAIEDQWATDYENDWNSIITEIGAVLPTIHDYRTMTLTTHAADLLYKYYVMFEWRSSTSNGMFNDELKKIFDAVPEIRDDEIPKKERAYQNIDTDFESATRHALLLNAYRKFQNGKGSMQTEVEALKKHMTFIFKYCDGDELLTSDTPAFIGNTDDGKLPVLICLPNLLIILVKKDPSNPFAYQVQKMDRKEIDYFNNLVKLHSEKYILAKAK